MPSAEFEAAATAANNFTTKPTDDELLKLYALYKQATVGDVNTARPGIFDMKGKYKWDAWESEKGKSQEEAEVEYIALVEEYKVKYA
ncbi:Triakontatetraneuropeptide [Drechslerella dactyloides]|uniref:Triakontatetraneuropeptide n=1 Tax=Drechslerella dactyloides TaxID=74499 RepID=A0AAD6IY61_DREDA|nr:Triakontatetraneuropeptide [Drechslerella dactyloides]